MKKYLVCALGVLLCSALQAKNTELTVYNQNFALVKDQRNFDLKKGINNIDFTDVASLIEPTSVHFKSLTSPESCVILEQNYEYDLVNSNKILSKYIDNQIRVITKDERSYEGKLLSYSSDDLILDSDEQLIMLERRDNISQILFTELPEGLITRPTLKWEIDCRKPGKHLTEVSYLTRGIDWHCEYVVVLDKEDKNISLDAWVNVDNESGASYKQAQLTLIAGDVKRADTQPRYLRDEYEGFVGATKGRPQFEEKSFFEYHSYHMERKTDIKDNQIKQVSLLNAFEIPITKEYILDFSEGKSRNAYYADNSEKITANARVELNFTNDKNSNLGMPLPQGKIKVYKNDDEGSLQFIGEDSIEHTPKDEEISLYIGDAFDIIADRVKAAHQDEYHTSYRSYEIILRNHKAEAVSVKLKETLAGHSNWDITNASSQWKKLDASTIQFTVELAPDSEEKITYTVKYWE